MCASAEQETSEAYPPSKYLNLYFKIKWFYVKYLVDQCPAGAHCPPPDYTGSVPVLYITALYSLQYST